MYVCVCVWYVYIERMLLAIDGFINSTTTGGDDSDSAVEARMYSSAVIPLFEKKVAVPTDEMR